MSRRITAEERIKDIFNVATEPEAARLLAIGQTITEIRFPLKIAAKPKAARKPKVDKLDPAGLDLRHAGSPQ